MRKFQHKTSLHEKAVQKVAKDTIKFPKTRGKATRPNTSKVVKTHWSDGVDPRIVKTIKEMHIPRVHKLIEVKGPTEVIIHNEGWVKS